MREGLPAGGCSESTVKCRDQHYRLDQVQGFREAGAHGWNQEVCGLHHPLIGQAGLWRGALLVFVLGDTVQGLWRAYCAQLCRSSFRLLRGGCGRGLLLTAFLLLHGRERQGPAGHKTSLLDTRAHRLESLFRDKDDAIFQLKAAQPESNKETLTNLN